MKRLAAAMTLMLATVSIAAPPAKAPVTPTFIIRQPTIIAFFSLRSGDLTDPDTKQSYKDFQGYIAAAKRELERHGVKVEQSIGTSFTVQDGKAKMGFTPVRRQCGYYFIAPGRQPQVALGVISDEAIVRAAQQYFGELLRE